MTKPGDYRKVMAERGLLAHATPPEPASPPPSEADRRRVTKDAYFKNLKRWVTEDPDAMDDLQALVKGLSAGKPGPRPKLTDEQVFLLVELLRKDISYDDACEKVAGDFGYVTESVKTKHSNGRQKLRRKANKAAD